MSDPILLWNEVALEANRVSHSNGQGEQNGPTLSSRALGIVHLAMYDAVAGVDAASMLPRYIDSTPSPGSGATVEAAVAGAAHRSLSALFPSQRSFFDAILAGAGDATNAGNAFGVAVADAILADRQNDPGAGSLSYRPSLARGKHRPDPDNVGQGFHAPDYGKGSKGFAISQRFELAAPPFDNEEYRAALRQVRAKGIKPEIMGTLPHTLLLNARTPDETVIGIYWGYDGAAQLGTPPRLYNQIVRLIALQKNNSVADNARLFAFVNVAMADAGILAWDQKYVHDFWRPVVGVREHDQSLGPAPLQPRSRISNDADPLWLPIGAPNSNRLAKNFTPPFPAYPSGHATFGAAALHIVRLFYGQGGRYSDQSLANDSLFQGLSFVSDELNGITTDNLGTVRPRHLRGFPRGLWQMIEENGLSRVYLGVHWVFDAFAVTEEGDADLYRSEDGKPFGGVPLGLQIAEDIFDALAGKGPKKSSVGPRSTGEMLQPEDRTPTYSSSYLR
jgi:vanadium chloroperoxidase